jgi:general stress protein YciG
MEFIIANQDKGFSSMDKEKVKEIAKKGGQTRADEQLGHEGYSEMGSKGGSSKKKDEQSLSKFKRHCRKEKTVPK